MSERKENPKGTKDTTKVTPKETQQSGLSRFWEGKASQGEQGISLQPVGSQATDPFAPQDSSPANTPEATPSTQPTQSAPTDTPQSQSPQSSQPEPKSSDE